MASPSSVRARFVQQFGEADAVAIEEAAVYHADASDWLSDDERERGSDPFVWALAIAIGFECMSHEDYRAYHGITAPWADLAMWIRDHAGLADHDGGIDTMAALGGLYEGLV